MMQAKASIVGLCVLAWSVSSAWGAPVPRSAVPISPQPLPAQISPQPVPVSPQPAPPQPVAVDPSLRQRPPVSLQINPASIRRTLAPDPQPSIAPNAEILLFIHGMDSRAEEADDITKALFATVGNTPPTAPTATVAPPAPPDPAPMIGALNQVLQKYKSCVLEKYETQADMEARGFPRSPPNAS